MSQLEMAIRIAVETHKGQIDKAGAPYILHPLRLMFGMDTEEEKVVAVLHDVVEDSDWTIDTLREEGFSEIVLAAIDGVTRRDDESYEEFVDRAGRNLLARKVKIADLKDNMDITRIDHPTDKDFDRIKKYHKAWSYLKRAKTM